MMTNMSLEPNDHCRADLSCTREARTLRGAVRQILLLTLIMLASLGGYLLVLWTRGPEARISTFLPLDDLVPFEPAWVWVYLIPYILGPLAFGLMRPTTFNWYVSRGLATVG